MEYPTFVSAVSGETIYPKIVLRNKGLVSLHNLSIAFSDIPLSWAEPQPAKVASLKPGEQASFIVKLSIPQNAKETTQRIRLIAHSDEKNAEADVAFSIFATKIDLAENLLRLVEQQYKDLSRDAEKARKLNKDVAELRLVLEESAEYLASAKENLRKERVDDSTVDLRIAEKLLSRGTGLLVKATFVEPAKQDFPWAQIAIVLFAVLAVAGGGFYGHQYLQAHPLSFLKKRETASAKSAAQAQPALPTASRQELQSKREKLLRVLYLLEDEYKTGAISQDAYKELRRRNESSLAQTEAALKNA